MKTRYGGHLLFSEQDDYGPVEVIELQNKMRSLHFGNTTQQATMFLHDRHLLVHKYTQAMLTSLAWQVPQNVLILGLGGGSLAKFLLHHFKNVNIHAVELRPLVAYVAQQFFGLPSDDKRLSLYLCAAEEFLEREDVSSQYDLILVDLFLTRGEQDISVGIEPQLARLPELLGNQGCITINVIGDDYKLYPGLQAARQHVGDQLQLIEVEQSNRVLLACNHTPPGFDEIDFTTLERRLRIPARYYYNKLMPV
jgi:spermidine synthase